MKVIIFLIVLFTCAIAVTKTALAYSDKSTLVTMLETVDRSPNLSKMSEAEVKNIILDQAKRNGISYLNENDIMLNVTQANDAVEVTFDYQANITLLPKVAFNIPMTTESYTLVD